MPVASIKARGRGSGRGPGQDVEEFEDVEKNFVRDLGELWAVALDLGLQMLPWALLWSAGVNHLRSTCLCQIYFSILGCVAHELDFLSKSSSIGGFYGFCHQIQANK